MSNNKEWIAVTQLDKTRLAGRDAYVDFFNHKGHLVKSVQNHGIIKAVTKTWLVIERSKGMEIRIPLKAVYSIFERRGKVFHKYGDPLYVSRENLAKRASQVNKLLGGYTWAWLHGGAYFLGFILFIAISFLAAFQLIAVAALPPSILTTLPFMPEILLFYLGSILFGYVLFLSIPWLLNLPASHIWADWEEYYWQVLCQKIPGKEEV